MDLGLRGKTAFIAGGSKGLGYGIAAELIREGAHCILGSRSEQEFAQAVSALQRLNPEATVAAGPLDTGRTDSIERWIASGLKQLPSDSVLDLLVVNSGGPPPGSFESTNDEAWEQGFQQLLLGAVRLVRGALPALKRSSCPAVVMVTSTSVRQPIDHLILSNVFRPAVAALAKSLSIELAEYGVRVNTLMPGRIDTDRVRQLDGAAARRRELPVEDLRSQIQSGIPLGRYGTAEEFGRLGAFLLSPAASYITGTTIAVDGGALRTL